MTRGYLEPVSGGESNREPVVERDVSEFTAQRVEIVRRVSRQGGQAEDQGGYVQVTVDNCGRVQSIQLDPRLSATALDRLGPHIAAVCAKAFDQRIAQISKIVAANSNYLDQATVDEATAMAHRLAQT